MENRLGNDFVISKVDVEECPCRWCEERHVDCHSTCKKYRQWKVTLDKANKDLQKKRYLDGISFLRPTKKTKKKKYDDHD